MKKVFKFIGIGFLAMIGLATLSAVISAISEELAVVLIATPFVFGIVPLIIIISNYFHNPFSSPYETITVNVSGRRNVDIGDIMDEYLMADNGLTFYRQHAKVMNWKQDCENRIAKSVWKKQRQAQYMELLNDAQEFTFRTVRTYQKGEMSETVLDNAWAVNYDLLRNRNAILNDIGYCMTINELDMEIKKKERANKKQEVLSKF